MSNDVRSSHVFAAARKAAIEIAQAQIMLELVPAHNAAMEDIRREAAEVAARYKNEALAANKKKARVLQLTQSTSEVLAGVKKAFETEMKNLSDNLGGVKFTCTEVPKGETAEKTYPKVKFADGSQAKWPKMYIPYKEFDQS